VGKSLNLALAQMLVLPGELAGNLARAEERIATAAARGADIILLPEVLDCGWSHPSARELAGSIPDGDACRRLRAAARLHRVYVCAGLGERTASSGQRGSEVFNAAVLIDPQGEVILHHRKINELGFARSLYSAGDRLGVVETPWGRIGLMICADAFVPGQILGRSLCLMGAEVILSPCAWAVPADHDNVREPYGQLWLDNYGPVARDFGVWIAGCSNVGPLAAGEWRGRKCIGSSLVCNPKGELVLRADYGEAADALLLTRLDLAAKLTQA